MHKKLSEIHIQHGIFDRSSFEVNPNWNIINDIAKVKELKYLHKFFVNYKKPFLEIDGHVPHQADVARSVDLPYIGKNVVSSGTTKYFFIFEGGTSIPTKLSFTMLACLWALPENTLPDEFFATYREFFIKYWPKQGKYRYPYAYEKLGINPFVADNAYAVDAVRVATGYGKPDWPKNRQILCDEISFIDPEIVIMAGRKAEYAVGKCVNDPSRRYHYVPYPIWTNQAYGEKEWAKLRKILSD